MTSALRKAIPSGILKSVKSLHHRWQTLSITTKFSVGFGGLLGLIIFAFVNSYLAFEIVSGQADKDISTSIELQRLVLEMDRRLRESRNHQRDFFLRYPEIGFAEARDIYAQQAVQNIDEILRLIAQFRELIKTDWVSDSLQRKNVDLNLYLLSADRYEKTFVEAVNLVTRLADEKHGLQAQLYQTGFQIEKSLESLEISLKEQYQALRIAKKEYLITRQRPYMQSAFNLLLELRQEIAESNELSSEKKGEIFRQLDDYQNIGQEILKLDVEIRSRFRDFDLQAQTIDSISDQLIILANEEVKKSEKKIEKASQFVSIILIVSFLIGIIFTALIARLFKVSITENILKLTQGVERIKMGRLDHRVEMNTQDELGELAEGFNQMATQIQALVNNLENQVAAQTVELRKREALLNETQKISQLGGWELNLKTQELIWTQEVYHIYGLDQDYQPTWEEMLSFFEGEARCQLEESIQQAIANCISFDLELPLKCHSGELIWVRFIGKPFCEEDKVTKLKGAFQNITDRKVIEVALQKAKEAADNANKAKTEFLSNMSHELRTPLNGILGYTQILKRSKNIQGEDRKGIEVIHQCGSHLLTLINDILDMSKIEARKIELYQQPFDLNYFLDGVASICKIKAVQKGLDFKSIYSPDLPHTIVADQKRLRQVLINLIGNAIKFTDQGQITFKVELIDHLSREQQTLAKIKFDVEDTGIGIIPEQLTKIFSPFEQAGDPSRMSEGTGLGLAISQSIVQLMGGKIAVDSQPNRGSKFFFEVEFLLDLHSTKPQLNVLDYPIRGYEGKRRTILVIDDRWENRSLVANLLSPLGFTLVEATDGKEGLEQVKKVNPDLVITDIFMPIMDGLEFTQTLRHLDRFKEIPIIASSASLAEFDEVQTQGIGWNDFITKPIETEVLLASLKKHLSLTWIYDESYDLNPWGASPVQGNSDTMFFPPKSELQNLYQAARIGDIEGMESEIKRLTTVDEKYDRFANHTLHLLDEFAIEEIKALLEEFFQKVENTV